MAQIPNTIYVVAKRVNSDENQFFYGINLRDTIAKANLGEGERFTYATLLRQEILSAWTVDGQIKGRIRQKRNVYRRNLGF